MEQNITIAAELLWKGMIGIFSVMILVALIVLVFGKIDSGKESK